MGKTIEPLHGVQKDENFQKLLPCTLMLLCNVSFEAIIQRKNVHYLTLPQFSTQVFSGNKFRRMTNTNKVENGEKISGGTIVSRHTPWKSGWVAIRTILPPERPAKS